MKTILAFLLTSFFAGSVGLAQEVPAPATQSSDSPFSDDAKPKDEQPTDEQPTDEQATDATATSDKATDNKVEELKSKAQDLASEAEAKAEEIAEKVNQDERAQKAAAGLLGKIYLLAESLNFSSFHWLAFALMASGVVSFALQLVLGKLALLFHASLNIKEICSDAVGLVISTVGLVLTTQAAAENSEFTHSPAAVLSAAFAGVALGFTLYRWGQHQELNAVKGKSKS